MLLAETTREPHSPSPRVDNLALEWKVIVPEEKPADAIEKLLQEQKAVDDRKQVLIEDLVCSRALSCRV